MGTPQASERRICKVSPVVGGYEIQRRVYEPMVISLGPHHCRWDAECVKLTHDFKNEVLSRFISKSLQEDETKDLRFFYGHVYEAINEIKGYYEEGVVESMKFVMGRNLRIMFEKCGDVVIDDPLAVVILRDVCYIVSYMENTVEVRRMIFDQLGTAAAVLMVQDSYKLENQIPFVIIKRVLDLRFGETKGDEIVCKYLSFNCFLNHYRLDVLPWEDDPEHRPLHLLEAHRATLLKSQLAGEAGGSGKESHFLTKLFKCGRIWRTCKSRDTHATSLDDLLDSPFRSITYLEAKGIYVRSNSSYSLTDIAFTSNPCYGILQLPTLIVDDNTKVLFSNLIAFEMLEGIQTDYTVTCYVNFMKSLIESPEDVKKLQEKHILRSQLGSDEEIVKTFKEISTHGINNFGDFADVKRGIDEHCDSKAKTWMSELRHNYFHSPWSVIALVGAALMLCFTFLQVYFLINPPN